MILDLLPRINSRKIILASASPRRKELLTQIGLRFTVAVSAFAEDLDHQTHTPHQYAEETSRIKANTIASLHPDVDIVVAADTVVVLQEEDGRSVILEKPSNRDDAFSMLQRLSGKRHRVVTGVTIIVRKFDNSQIDLPDSPPERPLIARTFHESTDVQMANLSTELIDAYISSGEPFDKAGGYGVQSLAAQFVERIEGCYYNVVGFPLFAFCRTLRQMIVAAPTPLLLSKAE